MRRDLRWAWHSVTPPMYIHVVAIMLKFLLLVNKQGQTRLSQYFEYVPVEERVTTEADIVRKCLARGEDSV